MSKKDQVTAPAPVCHGKPMNINSRVNRVSGPRIVYICRTCGHTRTIRV